MIKLDIEIGDTILTGKFKNKKTTVKTIGKDEHGTPTVNGRSILKFRVPKWKQNIFDENKTMNKKQLVENYIRKIVKEEISKLNELNVRDDDYDDLSLEKFFKKNFHIKTLIKTNLKTAKMLPNTIKDLEKIMTTDDMGLFVGTFEHLLELGKSVSSMDIVYSQMIDHLGKKGNDYKD